MIRTITLITLSLLVCPVLAGENSTTLPVIQILHKSMPPAASFTNALDRYQPYVEHQEMASVPPERVVTEEIRQTQEALPSLYNDAQSAIAEEIQCPYSLANARLWEALLASGRSLQAYVWMVGEENQPLYGLEVSITGYDRAEKMFYGQGVKGEAIEFDYDYLTKYSVYAEVIGPENNRRWAIHSDNQQVNTEKQQTLVASSLQELTKSLPVTSSQEQAKEYFIYQVPEISNQNHSFVKLNFELYLYKYKRGESDKVGYTIPVPHRLNTNYSALQFTRLWIEKSRCSNYIGNQYDRCSGWGSFFVEHVGIGTIFYPNSGIVYSQIVQRRSCNVAKFSYKNYKIPAIIRGKTEWIAY